MKCASCQSNNLEKLPPDAWSRNPGFRCRACALQMRQPNSTVFLSIVILLGAFMAVLLTFVTVKATGGAGRIGVTPAIALAISISCVVWAVSQLRKPVPMAEGSHCPPRTSRDCDSEDSEFVEPVFLDPPNDTCRQCDVFLISAERDRGVCRECDPLAQQETVGGLEHEVQMPESLLEKSAGLRY